MKEGESVMNFVNEDVYQGEEKLKTKHGFFTTDGKEYVITNPKTPMPWINIVSNKDYGFVISQAGGGYSWWKNSVMCRLTRWVQDLVKDDWGKFIFIKDNDSKKFWSLYWKPCMPDFEFYQVRYGMGYTIYNTQYSQIKNTAILFVPPDEPFEIWWVKLKNLSNKKRNLSLYSYFEWVLGNSEDNHREFQKTFIETSFDKELNAIFASKRKVPVPKFISTGLKEYPGDGFHAVNLPIASFETDKVNFIGKYNSIQNPQALNETKLKNKTGKWLDPIASLNIDIELEIGEEKEFAFLLGFNENYEKTSHLIKKYSDMENVKKAFNDTKNFWNELLGKTIVETPDNGFNFMTNWWLKYQAIAGRIWARTAYYQYSGGYGFRDQLQDSLAFLPLDPRYTKEQILLHAKHQFKEGCVYHWWHPLTEKGAKTNMSDDLLWLPYILLFYLEETNNYSILEEKISYVDGDEESLYQHCIKAIDYVLKRFSPRGLPLIWEGDWNDGMSAVGIEGKGESIWLGHFLYGILKGFASICEYKNDLEKKESFLKKAEDLKDKINKYGWDGEWFIRATRDDGLSLGSKSCEEGKIFLNAQTWAVINEITTEERMKKAMESAEKFLFKDYGPLLFYPSYKKPDPHIGYLSRYAPGVRENGGVYTHAGCWVILALCKLKQAEKAYQVYSKICPAKRGMEPEIYYAEPYVTCGNSEGPDSDNYGRGGWTWYSGSGAWLFKVSLDWILGIRASKDGLIIEPCIPAEWDFLKVKRYFRNTIYNIEISNPNHLSFGIKEIYLDGNKLDTNTLPPISDGKEHLVKVVMG
jgi:cellobiose phosphorylase